MSLSYRQKKLENFLLCYVRKWAGGCSFAHGCRNINVWRFSKLWTAVTFAFIGVSTWNLQRSFKMELLTLCKYFVQKFVYLNFWWRHCKPWIFGTYNKKYPHILCVFLTISHLEQAYSCPVKPYVVKLPNNGRNRTVQRIRSPFLSLSSFT